MDRATRRDISNMARSAPAAAFVMLALLVGVASSAAAGDLTLGWGPSLDEVTAGYDVEILDAEGNLLRTLDVGEATRAALIDLQDGVVYRFRVRPYDEWDHRARQPSTELVTMARPRIDALEGDVRPGDESWVTLIGANYDLGAQVVSQRADVSVLDAKVIDHQRLVARVQAPSFGPALEISDFVVVNPVRRTPDFVDAHTRLLDVDGSGGIDAADEASITARFGSTRNNSGYRKEFDVNGDGVIDGEDASLVRARLKGSSSSRRPRP